MYNTKSTVPAVFAPNAAETYRIVSILNFKLCLTIKNQGNHNATLEAFTNDPTQLFHIY
jgi:hypothetical protein